MGDPLFWLVLSLLVVCTSLAAFLAAAIPALRELGRAARSADKLFETLTRELPPTLEAIRLTGLEISDLTDDMSSGVQSAGQVVQKVDRSLDSARDRAARLQRGAKRTIAGVQAAWQSLTQPNRKRPRLPVSSDHYALPAPSEAHRGDGYRLSDRLMDRSGEPTDRDGWQERLDDRDDRNEPNPETEPGFRAEYPPNPLDDRHPDFR